MKVLIAGSTGLVGKELLKLLISDDAISGIYTLVRKPSATGHPRVQELVLDYADLETVLKGIEPVQAIFSCLGTTKAKTPDKNLYKAIEVDYPVQLAGWGMSKGVSQFHYISALGAAAKSSNQYLHLKGTAEQALLSTAIPGLYIYRPSLLVGKRTERRTAEGIGAALFKLINPLLRGKLKKYRSIDALTVARAMLHQSKSMIGEHRIIPSDEIESLGHL